MRVLIALMLLSATAVGQTITSVSADSFVNGETVTLIGSGFGTKTPAAPMIFEQFNYGPKYSPVGDDYGVENYFDTIGEDDHPIQYWDDTMSGDGFCVRGVYPDSITGSASFDMLYYRGADDTGFDISYGDPVYYSFLMYHTFPGVGVYGTDVPHQWKMHRLSHGGGIPTFGDGGGHDEPEWENGWNYRTSYPTGVFNTYVRDSYPIDYDTGGAWLYPVDMPDTATWYSWEYELQISSDALEADGWHSGAIGGGSFVSIGTNAIFCDNNDAICEPIYRTIKMGMQMLAQPDSAPAEWRVDDIYLDTSFARVILGNASTHDACTVRHPQDLSYWATDGDSIQFTMNQGSADADETWWFFVVDSTGSVSAGQSITIGGEAGSSAPGQPGESLNGSVATYSWTAADPVPDHYQVEVIEGSDLVRAGLLTTAGTSIKVTVDTSVQRRIKVYAINSSGQIQSTSPERVVAGS